MIYSFAIWTGSLTNRVKASTAITTTNRCNGESRWFHVSSISPKCNVYTVSAPVDTAILLAVIYPPCPECHTQMPSLHMYILHCHSLHICYSIISRKYGFNVPPQYEARFSGWSDIIAIRIRDMICPSNFSNEKYGSYGANALLTFPFVVT